MNVEYSEKAKGHLVLMETLTTSEYNNETNKLLNCCI